jgi:acetyl/propionyl-CoA carboxylase alpha subunit
LGRDDATEFVFRIPARVALTATRVDVFYSLNRHPIEIRLAGLDRDPGWVPAAGRFVAFHFE